MGERSNSTEDIKRLIEGRLISTWTFTGDTSIKAKTIEWLISPVSEWINGKAIITTNGNNVSVSSTDPITTNGLKKLFNDKIIRHFMSTDTTPEKIRGLRNSNDQQKIISAIFQNEDEDVVKWRGDNLIIIPPSDDKRHLVEDKEESIDTSSYILPEFVEVSERIERDISLKTNLYIGPYGVVLHNRFLHGGENPIIKFTDAEIENANSGATPGTDEKTEKDRTMGSSEARVVVRLTIERDGGDVPSSPSPMVDIKMLHRWNPPSRGSGLSPLDVGSGFCSDMSTADIVSYQTLIKEYCKFTIRVIRYDVRKSSEGRGDVVLDMESTMVGRFLWGNGREMPEWWTFLGYGAPFAYGAYHDGSNIRQIVDPESFHMSIVPHSVKQIQQIMLKNAPTERTYPIEQIVSGEIGAWDACKVGRNVGRIYPNFQYTIEKRDTDNTLKIPVFTDPLWFIKKSSKYTAMIMGSDGRYAMSERTSDVGGFENIDEDNRRIWTNLGERINSYNNMMPGLSTDFSVDIVSRGGGKCFKFTYNRTAAKDEDDFNPAFDGFTYHLYSRGRVELTEEYDITKAEKQFLSLNFRNTSWIRFGSCGFKHELMCIEAPGKYNPEDSVSLPNDSVEVTGYKKDIEEMLLSGDIKKTKIAKVIKNIFHLDMVSKRRFKSVLRGQMSNLKKDKVIYDNGEGIITVFNPNKDAEVTVDDEKGTIYVPLIEGDKITLTLLDTTKCTIENNKDKYTITMGGKKTNGLEPGDTKIYNIDDKEYKFTLGGVYIDTSTPIIVDVPAVGNTTLTGDKIPPIQHDLCIEIILTGGDLVKCLSNIKIGEDDKTIVTIGGGYTFDLTKLTEKIGFVKAKPSVNYVSQYGERSDGTLSTITTHNIQLGRDYTSTRQVKGLVELLIRAISHKWKDLTGEDQYKLVEIIEPKLFQDIADFYCSDSGENFHNTMSGKKYTSTSSEGISEEEEKDADPEKSGYGAIVLKPLWARYKNDGSIFEGKKFVNFPTETSVTVNLYIKHIIEIKNSGSKQFNLKIKLIFNSI